MKKAILTVSTISLLLIPTVVFAESETGELGVAKPRLTLQDTPTQMKTYQSETRQAIKTQAQTLRTEAQAERQEMLEQNRAEMEARRLEMAADRCEQMTARINNRVNQYEENKDKWHSRFRGIHTRLNDLADKLDEKDCDTQILRTNLSTYEDLLGEFAAAFRIFLVELQGTRAHVCGEDGTAVIAQVRRSNTGLQNWRSAALALKNHVDQTLKPNLRQIAQTCEALNTEAEAEQQ
jgi:chromosome segregation ATPase